MRNDTIPFARVRLRRTLNPSPGLAAILSRKWEYLFGVPQTSKSAVPQVSKPAGLEAVPPTWKSAAQQVWKPALRNFDRHALAEWHLNSQTRFKPLALTSF
jgi:hypothetical protein